jgi:DNA (cytosine-5)-methyltransferase 1
MSGRAELTFGDLFAGCGGFSLGAARAAAEGPDGEAWGLRPRWAVDINADAGATYAANIGVTPTVADARTVDFARRAPIDVLLFGFPCADFSEVGARRGVRGPQGLLYLEGVRALRALKPKAFVAENVRRLRSADGGAALRQIRTDLDLSGYEVTAHLYKGEEYGLPQTRHRVFLVGVRRDLGLTYHPPVPTAAAPRTVREALDRRVPPWAANTERRHLTPRMAELLAHVRHGESLGMAVKRPDYPAELRRREAGRRSFRGYYRKLDPDRPAGRVISGGGGGGKTIHHWETRPLTNRERARLQGFPDDFGFTGAIGSVCDQIGMSVPPPLAETVLSSLLATLAGTDYPHVASNIPPLPPRTRGRPPRLESRTDAERAAAYRGRAARERQAAARACAAALAAGRHPDLGAATLARIAAFVTRHAPAAAADLPALPETCDAPVGGQTRAQRHRARRSAEAASARALLARIHARDLLAAAQADVAERDLCRAFLARGTAEAPDTAAADRLRARTRAA